MAKSRGHEALRRHRYSQAGFSYFLTLCTDGRKRTLDRPAVSTCIRTEISALESDGHWTVRAAVIMPDHLHLLIRLNAGLTLGQCVARLKTKTRGHLLAENARWQDNYYEHRLRADEPAAPVLHYLHRNPYRQDLVPADKVYPLFWLGPEEAAWFRPLLNQDCPDPEWLR